MGVDWRSGRDFRFTLRPAAVCLPGSTCNDKQQTTMGGCFTELGALVGAVALLLLPGCSPEELSKLLLVSFDGFRWDYLHRVPTPNFDALIKDGVQVERVENVFVTKTFPNHYTMITGLYAESHGIVANEMFDPNLNLTFSMDKMEIYDSRWWDEAVPLWVTNQIAGHRSGAVMWPGSDVKIHGTYPTYYQMYNASMPFQARVQRLIDWFKNEEAINFGVLYWEEPDESGHLLGPENPLMDVVIADIDNKLGVLVEQLRDAGLFDQLNLIITSDHGMTELSTERIIALDDYIDGNLYSWIDKSPVAGILPKEGKFDEVYSTLVSASSNMIVYKKDDILDRFGYKHNDRIMPIIIEAKEGWTIVQNKNGSFVAGNHGYDNTLLSMQPIFVAHGPAFRQGYAKRSMRSVDLYPLMCSILGIQPSPNNGSLDNVEDLLKQTPPSQPAPHVRQVSEPAYAWILGSFLGITLVVGFLIIFVKQVTLRQLPIVPYTSLHITQPLLQEELQIE
ncbi:ectonucleotide pyrophosphatase/phosphodiesterase family member 5 [Brienomyrus brachyistius]|uniref:ectonucleotide pyrophosphatase/phosphodiesterase family member 5 n=1 Tax=Brienomyrus brachyistius TaxID=42636 RepID=UPI0020B2CD6B|nr:ectonucleotide pyrophosphatase/phosphodiesterase family member 5 [Brienomyrus brachyistius]